MTKKKGTKYNRGPEESPEVRGRTGLKGVRAAGSVSRIQSPFRPGSRTGPVGVRAPDLLLDLRSAEVGRQPLIYF